jgi:ribosomal protein S18 acetylase RimI-like enzyme
VKLIEALWEKENLGLKVLEIQYEEEDTLDSKVSYDKYEYILARVPAGKVDIVHKLEKEGFVFLETQLNIIKRVREIENESRFTKRLSKNIEYVKVEDQLVFESVMSKIDDDLFSTDRISLDPMFNKSIANKRYKNWIKTEFKKSSSEIHEIRYNSESIGFSMMRIEGEIMHVLLAGLYSDFKGSGLGFTIINEPLKLAKEKNLKFVETNISSNNIGVYRLYMSYGFNIKRVNYVMRKVVD